MTEATTPTPAGSPEPLTPSHLAFPVVGIGTSAGGVAALTTLFGALPADTGAAFVVVMHLSPKHESSIDQILQRVTQMPVVQVKEPAALRRNHVYVISPRKQLSMNDGYLRLKDFERPPGQHTAIDHFFRTLAEVHRERAVAIVLTGTGSDGSVGISRVRERGGVTLAQHPDDAEYEQMPRSAIATGFVDLVLPLDEIATQLVRLGNDVPVSSMEAIVAEDARREESDAAVTELDEDALRDIMMILRAKTGHDFSSYKRATVLRRIERRMQVNGLSDLGSYRDFLHDTRWERPALLKDMLISVTNFFRDNDAFHALEDEFVSRVMSSTNEGDVVRAWSAACATGEEAYSVAMLLSEAAASKGASVQVFGTDIDDAAIAHARSGIYPTAIATDISPERLGRFFTRDENTYRVTKQLRERVLFARHNVLQDPPFSRLDLITCRNLLIYLNREMQARVLETFHFALKPGGYLFLGSSESADALPKLFTPVDKKNRIYRTNPAASAMVSLQPPKHFTDERIEFPPAVPQAGRPVVSQRRRSSLADIHERAILRHLPPSVLVDSEGAVLHMTDAAAQFLRLTGGVPNYTLIAMVAPELRLEMRTSLFQSVHDGRTVRSRGVPWKDEEGERAVSIEVRPVRDPDSDHGSMHYLVVFHLLERGGIAPSIRDAEETPILLQLEEELKRTKQQLQDTLEESETSSEELKAANEELQSTNEELRSATEELETSKEELQSINEELITVNNELKIKVDETAKMNDDLRNFVASTDIATVFVDRSLCIKGFSPQAAHVFRLIATDVGRSLLDINHNLRYPELMSDAEGAFRELRTIEREVGAGDGRWYIARVLPYRTAEDRIDGAVLSFIDITLRHEAEQAMRLSEERMRLVAESATDYAIITTDLAGTVTSWSPGAERIFQVEASKALGTSADGLLMLQDRGAGGLADDLALARDTGAVHFDRWLARGDGVQVYCSGTTSVLGDGQPVGFAIIARDVTADKAREREREELLVSEKAHRERAQKAVAMKDEFLAVMSHELKHPLNLVMMNAELVARAAARTGDTTLASAADVIRRSVEGQGKIIDDLLDLSRLNTGKLTISLSDVDFTECVRSVVEGIGAETREKGVSIQLTLPDEPVHVLADGIRIEQIIWNLLSNAVKFSHEGGDVSIRVTSDDALVSLIVEDTGIGMAPEAVDRVFSMFAQEPGRRNRNVGGLGIGLALVRHLVNLHGGTVSAASEGIGKGARFNVVLPIRSNGERARLDEANRPYDPSVFAGLRILLVDDSNDLLGPFSQVLSEAGAEVTVADSAAHALTSLQVRAYDLLLSDIGIPEMDGHELIRRVRQTTTSVPLRAIAITGFGREQDIQNALAAGFDAHLSKPLSLRVLAAKVEELFPRG